MAKIEVNKKKIIIHEKKIPNPNPNPNPHPQSPNPNPQSPKPNPQSKIQKMDNKF